MLKNLGLALGALLVSVGLVEGLARVAGLRIDAPNLLMNDFVRGWTLRPGKQGWQFGEGQAYIRVNSAGLRDRERSIAKPAGTLRIALLGDSFTYGLGVPEDKAFASVTERRLAGCASLGGRRVEVMNFGVQGYGAQQELLTLRHHALNYHPDEVLLAVFTGNDISDGISQICCSGEQLGPFLVFSGDQLVLDNSFLKQPLFRPSRVRFANLWRDVRSYSHLVSLLTSAARGFTRRGFVAKSREEEGLRQAGDARLNGVYLEPKDANDRWHNAWRVWEATVLMMRDEARAGGAGFRIVVISNDAQVQPDPAVREAFLKRLGVGDLDYPNRRIRAFASANSIPVTDLADGLRRYAEERRTFLHGFKNLYAGWGHWNEEGHRLAGEMIAAELCEAAAKTPPSPATAPAAPSP